MITKKMAKKKKPEKKSPRTREDPKIPDGVSLSPTQVIFIEEYLATGNNTAAAEKAGVARGTPYDWFHDDFEFQAEYNRRKREVGEEVMTRYAALRSKALAVIDEALDDKDVQSAWRLLEAPGALDPDDAGGESADVLIKEAIYAEISEMEHSNYKFDKALDRLSKEIGVNRVSIAGTRLEKLLQKIDAAEKTEGEEEAVLDPGE